MYLRTRKYLLFQTTPDWWVSLPPHTYTTSGEPLRYLKASLDVNPDFFFKKNLKIGNKNVENLFI